MPVIAITSMVEFREKIKSGGVVVDFWAEWCGPCRMISPIFEKLSNDISGVTFLSVDVDAVPDVSQEVGIRAMPTFMAFKNGEKVNEMVGADPQRLQHLVTMVGDMVAA